MRVAFGCDHAGWFLKSAVMEYLRENDIEVMDFGAFSDQSVDYPDFAEKVAEAVKAGEAERGILICGTGLGMAITANKVPGIRAVTVSDVYSAEMARAHNDAVIVAFGSRVLGPGRAVRIVEAFLKTEYEGGRHQRRLDKITRLERKALQAGTADE